MSVNELKFAAFEGNPCVYTMARAWVMFNPPQWTSVPLGDIGMTAAVLTEQQFISRFGQLPMPSQAAD